MKLERSKEWWMARAAREENHVVFAGGPVADEEKESPAELRSDSLERASFSVSALDSHIAFGRFVNLMRRSRGMGIEAFAEETNLDPGEVLAIEDDVHFIPEPRTIYCLALAFQVPQERLMQLSGLSKARDVGLRA